MTLRIDINRYIPRKFMNTKIDGSYSPSEGLGKAVICNLLGIEDELMIRGDDKKKEPDWIIVPKIGLEVTFADTKLNGEVTAIKQVFQNQTKTLSENEVIDSIHNSIKKKAEKLENSNYEAVDVLSLFIFNLDPMPIWNLDDVPIRNENEFFSSFTKYIETRNRNSFFQELYKVYIQTRKFENIYIFTLFKEKMYQLFNIKAFAENPSEFITTFCLNDEKVLLPYCNVELSNIEQSSDDVGLNRALLQVTTTIIETV